MAALLESPQQYERDLRYDAKERKRTKDFNSKWAHGRRALPGVKFTWNSDEPASKPNVAALAKFRPNKRWSDMYIGDKKTVGQNVVKARSNWYTPDAQIRTKQHTRSEMADLSLSDLPLPSPSWVAVPTSASDNVLYSFDRKDTPDSKPLTLDVFVKEPNVAKETEKLVAKEYEVLDGNGESVKGKKARRVLNSNWKDDREEYVVEEDGFELI
ncbi:hypothetical protein QBC35DRAFT_446235 [Podospora australis]|uniref:Uncharacterized protein n=1 Tax=Podospora australis TaxID=1536484 RepID=A0AAN7APP8_9PEZI|nr:hypothetical protein QBC35DRAFT_446235 [Podospora australis]